MFDDMLYISEHDTYCLEHAKKYLIDYIGIGALSKQDSDHFVVAVSSG